MASYFGFSSSSNAVLVNGQGGSAKAEEKKGEPGAIGGMPSSKDLMIATTGASLAQVMPRSGGRGKARTKGKVFKADGATFNNVGQPPRWKITPNTAVHKIVEQYLVQTAITSSTTIPVLSGFNFTVNSISQIASLQNVFDQYRIDQVEVWLIPRFNNGNDVVSDLFASVIDYDDNSPVSAFADLLDYSNAVVTCGQDGHYRSFRPHAAIAAYSGVFTSFANVEELWIDAASPSVQHYGVKTGITATDTVRAWDMIVRLHTSWRNVR